MKRDQLLREVIILVLVLTLASSSLLGDIDTDCSGCSDVTASTGQCGNVGGGSVTSFGVPIGALAVLTAKALGIPLDPATTLIAGTISLSVTIEEPLTYTIRPGSCGADCCSGEESRLEITPNIVRTAQVYEGTAITGLPSRMLTLRSTQPAVLDWRLYEAERGIFSEDADPEHGYVWVKESRSISGGTTYALAFQKLGAGFELPLGWGEEPTQALQEQIKSPRGTSDAKMLNIAYVACECQCVRESLYEDEDFDPSKEYLTLGDDLPPSPPELFVPMHIDVPIDGGQVHAAFSAEGEGRYFFWMKPFVIPGCENCITDSLDPFTGEYTVEILDSQEVRETSSWVAYKTLAQEIFVYDLRIPYEELQLDKDGRPVPGTFYSEMSEYVPYRFVATGGAEARAVSQEISTQQLADAGCSVSINIEASAEWANDDRIFYADIVQIPRGWSCLPGVPSERILLEHQRGGVWVTEVGFEWAGAICSERGANTAPRGTHVFEFSVYEVVDPYEVAFSDNLDYRDDRLIASNVIKVLAQISITNLPPVALDDMGANIGASGEILSTITVDVVSNDEDPEDDILSAQLETAPLHGTLTLNDRGVFIYTPNEGFEGTDSFTYRAYDGAGQSLQPAVVSLEVHEITSSAPALDIRQLADSSCPDALGAGQDCQQFEVEVVDLDLSEFWKWEAVTLVAVSQDGAMCLLSGFGNRAWANQLVIDAPGVTKGVLAVRTDRNYATTSIQLLATDRAGLKDTATLRFTGNEPPKVTFDGGLTWYTCGGTTVTSMCMSTGPSMFTMDPAWFEAGCLQFRDLDGDVLTFRVSEMPQSGTVNLMSTGSGGNYFVTVMYEVDRDAMLACHCACRPLIDQLTVQATDPYGGVCEATMNIRFDVVNSPPVCENDSAVTPSGVPIMINVLANDSDPDEDALTIAEVAAPAGGGASIVANEVVYTPTLGVCGTETFSYVADDGYEGQTTGWISVEVTDNVNPVAICQPTTLYLDANGSAILDPAVLDDGSTDNCSIASFSASQKTFACNEVGAVPVQFTVFDGAGNSDTCWTTVTVVDAINPVAVGRDLTVQLDASGQATVLAAQLDNGSTDNCGITSYFIDGAVSKTFTCAHRGINLVAFTVIDPSGNSDSVNVSVTVEDVLPPTARCQDITVSLDANAQVTIIASAVDAGSSDNCGIASMTLDRDTFTEADIGDQTVTLTVTDTSGNTSTCTAVVTVQENTPPLIVCPADVDVDADPGQCYATGVNLGEPTATDNTQVDWGTLSNNALSQYQVGTTNVTWIVDDIYGNTGSCTQQVRVTESFNPMVTCPSDIVVYTHDDAGTAVSFSATASDNCDPNPTISFSPSLGATFPVGPTTVTCTATDDSGNTDTCTFTVTVIFQNDPPVANDDSGTVPEGGGCIVINVLGNDSDPDTDALSVWSVGSPQCGTTAIINNATQVRYCTEGCVDPPDEMTFTYTVTDGHNGFDTAIVTVEMPDGPILFIVPPPEPE